MLHRVALEKKRARPIGWRPTNTDRLREASVSGHIEQGPVAGYARLMERLNAIMVIDDRPEVRQAVALALEPWVERVESAASPEAVPALMAASRYDCALLDMNFAVGERSGREGITALDMIKAADPTLAVILMTAYGAVSLAVESLKRGASDFLLKPWRN